MTTPVFILYDERMSHHRPLANHRTVVEKPERILRLNKRLQELDDRLIAKRKKGASLVAETQLESSHPTSVFLPLVCHPATEEVIRRVHSEEYYYSLKKTSNATEEMLVHMALSDEDGDMYYSNETFLAATLACGGVISCVDAVLSPIENKSKRAIAVVRPPGHHACQHQAMGFCFFNSVVVAAKNAISTKQANRVVILDWDIHHGNGTQDLTIQDPNIFYISLHRKGRTSLAFFPGTGSHEEVGKGAAEGLNLNVPWSKGGVGNVEYAAAFSELILPLLVEYEPDLILISCGFDAARGDLIGDCDLTPEMYYCMTKSILCGLGEDAPIVIALEGGYNLDVISDCMEAVALALLDEPWSNYTSRYNLELPQDCPLSLRKVIKSSKSKSERLRISRLALSKFWDYDAVDKKNKGCGAKTFALNAINQSMMAIHKTEFWSNRDLILAQIQPQRKNMRTQTDSLQSIDSAFARMGLNK